MPYKPVAGSRPTVTEEKRPRFAPCDRCGVIRRAPGGAGKNGTPRTNLCKDCWLGLNPAERSEWR